MLYYEGGIKHPVGKHGRGTYYLLSPDYKSAVFRFEGDYVDDKRHGLFKGYKGDKLFMEGEFVNDKEEGIFVWYDKD